MTTIANAQSLMREVARNWDSGRPLADTEWRSQYCQSSVLMTRFDIAEALYWLDPNAIPADWQFRIGAGGGFDYRTCVDEYDGDGCSEHGGECDASREMLIDLGVNLDDPYDTTFAHVSNGERAERALVYMGRILHRYDRLLRHYYGDI